MATLKGSDSDVFFGSADAPLPEVGPRGPDDYDDEDYDKGEEDTNPVIDKNPETEDPKPSDNA